MGWQTATALFYDASLPLSFNNCSPKSRRDIIRERYIHMRRVNIKLPYQKLENYFRVKVNNMMVTWCVKTIGLSHVTSYPFNATHRKAMMTVTLSTIFCSKIQFEQEKMKVEARKTGKMHFRLIERILLKCQQETGMRWRVWTNDNATRTAPSRIHDMYKHFYHGRASNMIFNNFHHITQTLNSWTA